MKIGYLRGFETLKERQQLGDLGIDGKKLQLSLISHGSLRGKCGIVSCILGIGPKHRWVHAPVTLTPEEHLLVPAGKRGWGCKAGLRVLENRKDSCTCQKQTPDRSVCSPVNIPITLFLLLCVDSRVTYT